MSRESDRFDTVRFSIGEDGLAELTLDRPDCGNALNRAMAEEMREVAAQCTETQGVRALLVTGNGQRFSVGGDIRSFDRAGRGELGGVMQDMARTYHDALESFAGLDVPIVCGVHGSAAGAGLGLTFVADVVLAAEGTKFALAFTGLGIAGDSATSWFLPRLIGPRRTAELYFEQRILTAEEAAEWGLATRVVPAERLHDEARGAAKRLAAGPTMAFAGVRRLLRQSWDNTLHQQLRAEVDALGKAGASHDAMNAVAAFGAKRPAIYQGR